jgi:hypothetical protein
METKKIKRLPMNLQMFAEDDEPIVFDPTTLTPEALAYMNAEADKRVTSASKTAADNAKKTLMADETFRNSLKVEIETNNNLTVQEKMDVQLKDLEASKLDLAVQMNKLNVKNKLIESGLKLDSIDNVIDVLVNVDPELSMANTDAFVNTLETLTSERVEKAKQELLQNGLPLDHGNKKGKGYQEQYTEYSKAGRTADAIAIKQKAFSENIIVK